MQRRIEPEWLDVLAPGDPRAAGSRRDLQRLNAWMNNAAIMADTLRGAFNGSRPQSLIEIGAGDGQFLWQVACRLAPAWPGARALLLDRQDSLGPEALGRFGSLGWQAEALRAEALDWLRQPTAQVYDALVANLFLHHFTAAQLAELLSLAARRTRVFVAIEPRRSVVTLAFCRMVWVIGCNPITRHDAPASARAGFTGGELSRLWPADGGWSLREGRAGCFSHLFVARRLEAGASARQPGSRSAFSSSRS